MSSPNSRADIDARATRLKEIFFAEESRLLVPEYQREFSWKKEQLEAFWEDLVGPNARGTFGGTVLVLNSQGNRKELVDGQQRATTCTIFLAVIRDIADSLGAAKMATNIQENDIQCRDADTFVLSEYRLKTSLSCREFFEKHVQSFPRETLEPVTREHKKIAEAYSYFENQITKQLDSDGSAEAALMALRSKVRDLVVVCIEVFNEDAKFEIFESVNARGLSLSPADLIKNHVLSRLGATDHSSANQRWVESSAKCDEVDMSLTDVLRYVRNGRDSFVKKNVLFQSIKASIDSEEAAKTFLHETELAVDAIETLRTLDQQELYAALHWPLKHISAFVQALELLNLMGIKQHLALFLAVYLEKDRISPGIASRIATISARFCVAHFGFMQGPGNRVERLFSRSARKIRNAAVEANDTKREAKMNQVLAETIKEFGERWPTIEELQIKLDELTYDGTTNSKAMIRVILASIEMDRNNGEEVKINWPRINIEHIQPQNPQDLGAKAEFGDHIHALGNLVLLQERVNKMVGNKPPKEKASKLKESQLLVTREVAEIIELQGWSVAQIEDRTKRIAESALRLFQKA